MTDTKNISNIENKFSATKVDKTRSQTLSETPWTEYMNRHWMDPIRTVVFHNNSWSQGRKFSWKRYQTAIPWHSTGPLDTKKSNHCRNDTTIAFEKTNFDNIAEKFRRSTYQLDYPQTFRRTAVVDSIHNEFNISPRARERPRRCMNKYLWPKERAWTHWVITNLTKIARDARKKGNPSEYSRQRRMTRRIFTCKCNALQVSFCNPRQKLLKDTLKLKFQAKKGTFEQKKDTNWNCFCCRIFWFKLHNTIY